MRHLKIERVVALLLLLGITGLSSAFVPAANASALDNSPTLPAGCESIQVEAGNGLAFSYVRHGRSGLQMERH